jgi:hypothetical protein
MAIMGQLRPAAPTSQSDKQKFPEPDKFDGTDRTKLKLFLGQLHTKFKGEKAKFSTQKHRILYAVSLLRGVPQEMAMNLYDEDDDDYPWAAYPQFKTWLEGAFGDPDPQGTANRELRKLRQNNKPYVTYLNEFQRLMAPLEYDDDVQIEMNRHGLCEEIKDLLVGREVPEDFNEFSKLCIKLDNDWRRRHDEKQGRRNYTANAPVQRTHPAPRAPEVPARPVTQKPIDVYAPNYYGPRPMQIEGTRRAPLTEQEKERRRKENLCSYCGGAGHYA